jgi:hypothetical protein
VLVEIGAPFAVALDRKDGLTGITLAAFARVVRAAQSRHKSLNLFGASAV